MKMTGKAVQVKTVADGLIELKERFAAWRAVRKLGLRIPRELWAAAVEMVAVHGACRVAGELNLDYDCSSCGSRRLAARRRRANWHRGSSSCLQLPVPCLGTALRSRSAWSRWPTSVARGCAGSSTAMA
jgi:hypothetical protein